jgi:hypothetical protein
MQSCVFRQGGVVVVVVVIITSIIIIVIITTTTTIISLEILRQAFKLYFNNVRLQIHFYAIYHTVNTSMGWSGVD